MIVIVIMKCDSTSQIWGPHPRSIKRLRCTEKTRNKVVVEWHNSSEGQAGNAIQL